MKRIEKESILKKWNSCKDNHENFFKKYSDKFKDLKSFQNFLFHSRKSENVRQLETGMKSQRYQNKKKDKKIEKALFSLKEKGSTEHELLKKFNIDFKEIKKCKKEWNEEYELYEQRNEYNEKIILLLKKNISKIIIKPKVWKYSKQSEGQPYMIIQFPNSIKSDKLSILPIGDVHLGHSACDMIRFKQDLEYVKNNDNVFCFLSGDILENSNKLSIADGVYEQVLNPMQQIKYMIELLSPISHKILWMIPGNHEERTKKTIGIDVLEGVSDKLEIPYFNEPVYIDILWKTYVWSIFDQHGKSCSQTKGGKLNAAAKPIGWTEFTNFYIMGHVHDKMSNEINRIVRNRVTFKLDIKKQYNIVLGAYLKYFNTYGSRAGYSPNSNGSHNLKLYANGDYFLGE